MRRKIPKEFLRNFPVLSIERFLVNSNQHPREAREGLDPTSPGLKPETLRSAKRSPFNAQGFFIPITIVSPPGGKVNVDGQDSEIAVKRVRRFQCSRCARDPEGGRFGFEVVKNLVQRKREFCKFSWFQVPEPGGEEPFPLSFPGYRAEETVKFGRKA